MIVENRQILVIDDERGMREGIKRILELQGHHVDTADNGTLGIELGSFKEYDLYFIDLKMPDIEGTQVLREIKLCYPEAICIIVTAFASIETAVTTTRLGAYQYISKPFTPEELNILVNRALERRWYILEARRLKEEQQSRLLEVANEKSRMRTIINALDDGILVVNQNGEIVLFNPGFLKLLDIKNELKIGETIYPFLPAELSNQIQEILFNRGVFKAIKQELVVKPPAEMVIMANTTPILNNNNELVGLVSVLRDITELKQVDVLKSQFVNMAAHELKSPLSAVQGYLEMIADHTLGDAPEIYDGYVNRSLERTKSLVALINDLLNISRLDANKVRRDIVSLNLSDIIFDELINLKDKFFNKNLYIELSIDNMLFVEADEQEVRRVFKNLISNAIKYNRDDGQIFIRTKILAHYFLIEIRDTGIGLSPEEKDRLFEEFFRAKNKYTRRIPGTGLGLSIVKKILDTYAGKIEIESTFEQGSVFFVSWPKPVKSATPVNTLNS